MIKTRGKKIVRDILARKGRSIMVILSIMIGVFGVSAMMSITDLLNRQLKEDVKSEQISHLKIYVISSNAGSTAAQNLAYLDALKAVPGVVDVEGQAVYPVTWQHGRENDDAVMLAFSDSFGESRLESISRVVEGRYPNAGEIAVEPRFAAANDLHIGDSLRFPNTGDRAWTIVGLLLHPYYTEFPATQTTVQVAEQLFANYDDARQIVGFTGLSAIHVRLASADHLNEQMGELGAAISRATPYVPYYTYQDTPGDDFITSTTAEFTGAMDMLGIIAMIVSGFLVTNVMNTVVMEQRQQIGAMKSVGANFIDNLRMYGGMALAYGVIGTAIGVALAIPVAANAARPLGDWLGAYIAPNQISPLGLGVGAVMGLLVPVLASLLPVWQASRVTILHAVTDRGISSNWGQTRVARAIGRLPLPILVLQAISNIWQKRGRLLLTVLTLTAAVGAFMGATAAARSLDTFIQTMVGIHHYDIRLAPQRAGDYERLVGLVENEIDGVAAVYPGVDVLAQVPGFVSNTPLKEGADQVTIVGFDPATPTFDFSLMEGTGWQDDPTRTGIVITRALADKMHKQAGDPLAFRVGGRDYQYEIIGVDRYIFEGIFMDWRELARIADYQDEAGQPMVSTVYIDLRGHPSIDAVDAKIDQITALLSANGIDGSYHNQPKAAKMQSEQSGVLGVILQTMSFIMAAVSAIGLMAALSMAVFERQKEIGVMRSVGARSRTIMAGFMLEGILIGVLAWVVAIPISMLMSQGILGLFPIDYLELDYPPQLVVFGLAGVLMVVALASIGPSLMASRKTVAEILRYQ